MLLGYSQKDNLGAIQILRIMAKITVNNFFNTKKRFFGTSRFQKKTNCCSKQNILFIINECRI